ncbi:MAG: Na+/H+ antiporter NhaD/arsenite permease-like protein [Crocinitomicaceae bacterium]|jgi:Na+/H+ antiporter NhaD/arsenite permease-like protein
MEIFIVSVFVLGYLAITLEHTLKIDKLVPALLMMALAWAGIAFGLDSFPTWFDSHSSSIISLDGVGHEERLELMEGTLLHHFGKTCEILMFLVGAMTIVEIIDHFNGFQTIKRIIKTNKKSTLLWIVCILGFILSAIIDNLTATIVLITILRKIVKDTNLRMWYAGMIIIAANAGGAWSPIGDVTTTMLWMGDKVTATQLIIKLLLPSLICMVVPTVIAGFLPAFKGKMEQDDSDDEVSPHGTKMLVLGLAMIVFVPIFKTVTHLPPYVGMMLSLSIVALVAEFISSREFSMTSVAEHESGGSHHSSPTFGALSKIEMPSILFFLGILMTVAAMESLGLIFNFGQDVNKALNTDVFITLLGAGSAVIDNVPLVAASMGMFQNETDHETWHFIAYAAGTGGSMLIIGSAAGVVAMGMEKISFFWYLKKISLLALVGYLAGVAVFLLFK